MANDKTTDTKREAAIKASVTENGGLNLAFSHGELLYIHPARLHDDIVRMAILHGLKQKLVDAAAISRNPDTGKSATIADKFNAVKAVYDRLMSGSWNKPHEDSGNSGGLLLRALCRMQPGKTVEQLKAWLEGKTDKEKAALRANPRVAKVIDEIRSESAKTDDIDTDELLNQLDD